MAKDNLRATGNRKASPPKSGMGYLAVAASVTLSGGIIMVLAIIAPEIAMVTLLVMMLGGFVLFDKNRRGLWERATTARIKNLNENHVRLARDVERQRYDLLVMREELDQKLAALPQPAPQQPQLAPQQEAPIAEVPRRSPLDLSAPPKKAEPAAPKAMASLRAFKKKTAKSAPEPVKSNEYAAFSNTVVRELVHSAVRSKRIEVFVQPIMRLPQRKVRFYEVYARIRAHAGVYLPASRYMDLANEDKVMNDIDHLLLMQCMKTIRDTAYIDRAAPFFINITPATLTNMNFMKQLLGFLSENRSLAPRMIFEIRQSDFAAMNPAILEILRGLGSLGCSLSVDHVKSLDFDIKFLQVLKVRFIKVNAKQLLAKTKSDREFIEVERQKRKLEGNGIGFIVEKIEDEKTLRELLDFGINYGQGYLFGKPDLQGAYRQQTIDAA